MFFQGVQSAGKRIKSNADTRLSTSRLSQTAITIKSYCGSIPPSPSSHPCSLSFSLAMSFSQPINFGASPSLLSVSPLHGGDPRAKPKITPSCFEETKEKIRQMINNVELSVSAYDTAWVAMVPSPNSPDAPFFPQCVNWLLENQRSDGSWGQAHSNSLLMKDTLSSTLACIIALKRWDVGLEHMNKGLDFMDKNLALANNPKQHSPVGFNIIFPGMIEMSQSLGLNLSLEHSSLNALVQERELELRRGRSAYLSYISEGIEKQDWEMVMKYQRKNGSLFNSPSTSAAAFTRTKNGGCLNYICMLLAKLGNAVPTIYPLDLTARLHTVDHLQRLGIEQHFQKEIKSVLDETYRCWLQGDEDIFLDVSTCAMAFRLLRVNGYDVSSDLLTQYTEEDEFSNCLGGYLNDIASTLELFKASQIMLHSDEHVLEQVNSWTRNFLNCKLVKNTTRRDRLSNDIEEEVKDALMFTYHSTLERISNKKAIDHYSTDSTRILKTSYRCLNFGHEDVLKLAVDNYNTCQSIHRKELEDLARWIVETKLDKLKFARQKLEYCYLSASASLPSPELSESRLSWTKGGVLTTVVDDFFDVGGSEEELINLIQLVERWDINSGVDYCSEAVEIIFTALHGTVCEIGDRASIRQGRPVTSHIIDIWLDLLKSMLKEFEWMRDKVVPPMDDYMSNSCISFALGPIVLPALYFVGPKLSKEIIGNVEYRNLFKLMSTCGRLLNDIQGFERESREGKLNALSLLTMDSGGNTETREKAVEGMKVSIEKTRRELLRSVLGEVGSTIPRACKDLFWKMSQVLHLFYMNSDGFNSQELMKEAKALIGEPIVLDLLK